MYRIMMTKEYKENYGSLYAYKTQVVDNVIKPIEFETDAELDAYVEDLLNNKGFAKSDFVIVVVKDYTITTDINVE